MCPACIPSATMALVGLTTSGGITAAILPRFFRKKVNDAPETEEKPESACEKDATLEER